MSPAGVGLLVTIYS